ncbi:MAG: SDR family oxidoreductase [Planctomycetota bacterium]
MATAFVTGANRGLGLEFVKQLAGRGDFVYASCRSPDKADELRALEGDTVKIVECDVADQASCDAAAQHVDRDIDLLVNNAGVYGPTGGKQHVGVFDGNEATRVLRINVVGVLLMTQALAGKLANPATNFVLSSGVGSISRTSGSQPIYYAASKAAVNMVCKVLGDTMKDRGVTTLAVSPGWVQTDMGGENASLTPEQSINRMLRIIDNVTPEQSGQFLESTGNVIPY